MTERRVTDIVDRREVERVVPAPTAAEVQASILRMLKHQATVGDPPLSLRDLEDRQRSAVSGGVGATFAEIADALAVLVDRTKQVDQLMRGTKTAFRLATTTTETAAMPKPKNLSPKKPKTKTNGAAKHEAVAHLDPDTSPGAVKQGVRNFVVASKRPVFLHEIGAALDYATADQIDEAITSLSDGETPTLFVCLDRRLGLVGRDDQDVLETAEDEDNLDDEDTDEDDDDAPPSSPEKVTTRYLSCPLTAEEIEKIRVAREAQDREIEQLQAECDQHFEEGRALKKKIDALYEEGLAKSKRIANGVEMRDVPCEDRKEADPREDSPTKGEIIRITYRLDTNEAIEWRPLTFADRQGVLFGDVAAPSPADGGVVVREPDAIEPAPLPTETGAEIAEDLFA